MQCLEVIGVRLTERSEAIDLRLEPGQVYALLGGNRSGKSALARLATGLDVPREGNVMLGESTMDVSRGAFVYQTFINYPSFTVRENLLEPTRRLPVDVRDERLLRVVEVLSLDGLLERKPAELSGGQQQRVAIGRAVMKGAAVLALDEPLVNLDFSLRDELMTRLNELLHGEETIVIYASSVASEAMTVADELILLDGQAVIQRGAPLDVFQAPASRRAADLTSVPRTNWIPDDADHALAVEARRRDAAIGYRPEHLGLAPLEGGDRFEARVTLVETDGTAAYLHVDFADSPWVVRAPISAQTLALDPGTTIVLYAAPRDRIVCRG